MEHTFYIKLCLDFEIFLHQNDLLIPFSMDFIGGLCVCLPFLIQHNVFKVDRVVA